jgi:hypothetical protein
VCRTSRMQQWPEEVEQDALPPPPPEDWAGKRVELHGLKGAAEFNGRARLAGGDGVVTACFCRFGCTGCGWVKAVLRASALLRS